MLGARGGLKKRIIISCWILRGFKVQYSVLGKMRPYTIVNTVRSQLKWSQHGLRLLRENFPSVLTKTLRDAHCHGSSSHALNQGTKKSFPAGEAFFERERVQLWIRDIIEGIVEGCFRQEVVQLADVINSHVEKDSDCQDKDADDHHTPTSIR